MGCWLELYFEGFNVNFNWLTVDIKLEVISFFLVSILNFFESLSKPAMRGLIISASTIAVVEIAKHDYSVGISAATSWLLLVIASKRIFK